MDETSVSASLVSSFPDCSRPQHTTPDPSFATEVKENRMVHDSIDY